jgi:hypothetical protein
MRDRVEGELASAFDETEEGREGRKGPERNSREGRTQEVGSEQTSETVEHAKGQSSQTKHRDSEWGTYGPRASASADQDNKEKTRPGDRTDLSMRPQMVRNW